MNGGYRYCYPWASYAKLSSSAVYDAREDPREDPKNDPFNFYVAAWMVNEQSIIVENYLIVVRG